VGGGDSVVLLRAAIATSLILVRDCPASKTIGAVVDGGEEGSGGKDTNATAQLHKRQMQHPTTESPSGKGGGKERRGNDASGAGTNGWCRLDT